MDHQLARSEARRTLCELRDARVANGLDLEQVAVRSRIPAALIEELERGELSRWPRALYGRTQLVRYARAAGLDPDRVVGAVMPLLDQPAPADLSPEPPTPPASGSDGRIAIIASSFDKDEELFASEERAPQDAARRPITAAVAPAREEPARVHPRVAPLRPPIAPRPRRTARVPVTGARRRRPSRTTMLALALGAALLCGAALWSYGPRPQLTTEVRVEHPAAVTSPAPAVSKTRPQPPPPAEAPMPRIATGAQRTVEARTPRNTPAVVAPPAPSVDANPDPLADRAETVPLAPPPPNPVEAGASGESPGEAAAPPPTESSTRLTAAHPAEGLNGDAVMYSPAFSAKGEAIYFQRESHRGSALMRADTDPDGRVVHVARVVDDGARNFHVRPSPNGESIAFDSDRDGTRAVYVARADGHQPQKVSGTGYAAVPSWSPDGGRLVFVRAEPDQSQVWNLWQLTLASGDLRRLTSYRVGQPWGASWFPDGRRIAYSHETALVILDLTTGLRQVYQSPRAARLVRTPAVSPSGNEILFQVFRDGAWLLNVTSGAMHRVLDDASAEEYAWSPDGRQVAYHSRRAGHWGLWVASVD